MITQPTIPVDAYGGELLNLTADALVQVLPYAAAITAFAIGVGMLRRWLGHRKATTLGQMGSAYERFREYRLNNHGDDEEPRYR